MSIFEGDYSSSMLKIYLRRCVAKRAIGVKRWDLDLSLLYQVKMVNIDKIEGKVSIVLLHPPLPVESTLLVRIMIFSVIKQI